MNRFKRGIALFATIAAAALLVSACASGQDAYYAAVKAQLESENAVKVEQAKAEAARWTAVAAIAPRLDASGAAAATGIAFAQGGLPGAAAAARTSAVVPPPKSGWESAWTAALQVADVALRAYGVKVGGNVAITQSNNQAQTAIASYGAFTTMGGQIATAGTAGYPYVQAPGAVTLSGAGVIGSGLYTGPVTTTHTCSGGTAAAGGGGGPGGGTTAGAPGGAGAAGGSAQGGTC